MTNLGSKLAAAAMVLTFAGCAHTEGEKRQRDYHSQAESRVKDMDKNIKKLEVRETQLLGEPKAQLDAALQNLRGRTEAAKAELKELESRDENTWVEKKPTVDRQLSDMDAAYDQALKVLSAH